MKKFADLDQKEKIKVLIKNPWVIQYIKNPTEEMQLIAIKDSKTNMMHIKKPTNKVRLISM